MIVSNNLYFSENQVFDANVGTRYSNPATSPFNELTGEPSTNTIDLGEQDDSVWINDNGSDGNIGYVAGGSVDIPITVMIPTISGSAALSTKPYIQIRLKTAGIPSNTGDVAYVSPVLSMAFSKGSPRRVYPGFKLSLRALPSVLRRYIWLDYVVPIAYDCTFTAMLGTVHRNEVSEH
ncbi:hypothetical protein [Thiolapillus sp.]|uniref:hypothetical protein n=1 Tax=Thiolapillus sp. TaxID=2017437 RepID=UPI003AF58A0A